MSERTVTTELVVDTTALEKAMERMADLSRQLRAAKRAAELFAVQMDAVMALPDVRRRSEVRRAGREARWYVRGGLDPAYASEAARDAEVRRLLAGGNVGMAVAFAQGWSVHRNGHTETGRWVGTWMGQSRSFVTPTSGERA